MEKKYYREVNIMKGLAMLLAVIGHSLPDASKNFWIAGQGSFSEFLYHWIYSFHMAAFFCCAGFLFIPKIKSTNLGGGVILKRFKRLMIPYFFYSFSYLILKSQFALLADHPLEDNAFLLMFVGVSPSFGCWFLWVLFMISMLFVILRGFNIKIMLIISLALYLMAVMIGSEHFIGHVGDVMCCSLWFALGGLVGCNYDSFKGWLQKPWLGVGAFGCLTTLQLTLIDLIDKDLLILVSMAKTLCGIEMIYVLAVYLTNHHSKSIIYKFVNMIGNYCMDIYLLSMFVLVPMRILYVNFGLMNYINYYLYIVISVAVGIAIPYYASRFIVRKNKVMNKLLIGSC